MRTLAASLMVLLLVTALGACQHFQTNSNKEPEPPKGPKVEANQPKETYEEVNYYYDFGDILIPKELEMETDESYVFETTQFKTGIMLFEGNVDHLSLFDFFINNMSKDGWSKQYTFKSSKSILVFEKPDKNCIIQIVDRNFTTSVVLVAVEQKGDAPLGRASLAPKRNVKPERSEDQPQIIDEQNLPK